MGIIKIRKIIVSVFFFFSFWGIAYAQPPVGIFGQAVPDLISYIKDWVDWAVLVVVPICTIVIIVAGIMYITSAGNPERIARAKYTLITALVSLALVLLAKAIVFYLVGVTIP